MVILSIFPSQEMLHGLQYKNRSLKKRIKQVHDTKTHQILYPQLLLEALQNELVPPELAILSKSNWQTSDPEVPVWDDHWVL